jgi:hypothetical protein
VPGADFNDARAGVQSEPIRVPMHQHRSRRHGGSRGRAHLSSAGQHQGRHAPVGNYIVAGRKISFLRQRPVGRCFGG